MTSRLKRHTSRLLIAALLAAQALLAVHACNRMADPRLQVADAAAPIAQAAADPVPDCDPMSPVCQKHCEDEQGNTDTTGPWVPLAFMSSFSVRVPDDVRGAPPVLRAEPSLSHAHSPPLAIRHCCWRI